MTIPETLKVGGIVYTIELSPDLEDCGDFDGIKGVIRINSNLSQELQELTLIHEMMHAMNSEFNDGVMHALMDSLACQLYQTLKENNLLT